MRNAKILAAGLLALVLLAGCGAKQAAEPVSITFMHGWGGSGRDHTAMRQIYADFEKANPDISVVYDTSPDITVVMQKANDMLAADKAPDFISTNGSTQYVSNAIRKNLALDLTPELEADPAFAADVADSTLEALRQPDGAVYTLPDAVEYIGYWYNEALFREAGVTDTGTPEGTVEPPATWEEFWRACDKLAAAEKKLSIRSRKWNDCEKLSGRSWLHRAIRWKPVRVEPSACMLCSAGSRDSVIVVGWSSPSMMHSGPTRKAVECSLT